MQRGDGGGGKCGTDLAPGPNSDPHRQADEAEADPVAVPVSATEAETMVTLRELQEALEEEVLTRQSLSRELEAIRTANQNFSRSGLRCWGKWGAATLAVSSPNGSAHPLILPQPTTGGRGPEPRPGGACSAATGADGDAAGPRSGRRVPHPFLARGVLGGDGGTLGV